MAGPTKPLFNSDQLQDALSKTAITLTGRQRKVAAKWAEVVQDPGFLQENEKPHQGAFLRDLFHVVLGYDELSDSPPEHHMKVEAASEETAGGKTPDGRLGFYGEEEGATRAVIELKAPGADLDARQHRTTRLTPVEQAFGYAPKFDDCRWVIVSNFTTIRLYRTTRGEAYAHEVRVADLADEEALRRFVFLFHRERLLGTGERTSPTEELAARWRSREKTITSDFYAFYHDTRLRLFHGLVELNPPPEERAPAAHEKQLLRHAQTLLDRLLFIAFCEDTGLLPRNVLKQAVEEAGSGFVPTTRWQQLQGLFRAIDEGRPDLHVNAYNGGLFARDPELEALDVPDVLFEDVLTLAGYDFRSELNVNLLGRVFEQSISDLEALHAAIEDREPPERSKRKEEGVFYTPEFITRFIVQQTVGAWLDEQFDRLLEEHDPEALPESYTRKREEAERKLWHGYQDVLRQMKVVDPACGSGAFLVAAFDYLYGEYERVNRQLARLEGGQQSLFDLDRQILQENLYGVDLNSESVEITRLSLWLKTARTDKPLTSLDHTIRSGDSVVATR